MSKISTVHLNEPVAALVASPDVPDAQPVPIEEPVSVDVPEQEAAEDIDTDELESLLIDLKKTKKQNKAPSKPRVRKPKAKAVVAEPVPIVVETVVAEPVIVAPVADEAKTKRKYTRKPNKIPEVVPEAPEPVTPRHVEEPARKTPGSLIEEMQRAERALRYQMRKSKMQTLVTQAF